MSHLHYIYIYSFLFDVKHLPEQPTVKGPAHVAKNGSRVVRGFGFTYFELLTQKKKRNFLSSTWHQGGRGEKTFLDCSALLQELLTRHGQLQGVSDDPGRV